MLETAWNSFPLAASMVTNKPASKQLQKALACTQQRRQLHNEPPYRSTGTAQLLMPTAEKQLPGASCSQQKTAAADATSANVDIKSIILWLHNWYQEL
jgi:hypothetical protein